MLFYDPLHEGYWGVSHPNVSSLYVHSLRSVALCHSSLQLRGGGCSGDLGSARKTMLPGLCLSAVLTGWPSSCHFVDWLDPAAFCWGSLANTAGWCLGAHVPADISPTAAFEAHPCNEGKFGKIGGSRTWLITKHNRQMKNGISVSLKSSVLSVVNFLLRTSHSSACLRSQLGPLTLVMNLSDWSGCQTDNSLDLIDVISHSSSVLLPSNRIHRSASVRSALPGSTFLSRTGDTCPPLYVLKGLKQQVKLIIPPKLQLFCTYLPQIFKHLSQLKFIILKFIIVE